MEQAQAPVPKLTLNAEPQQASAALEQAIAAVEPAAPDAAQAVAALDEALTDEEKKLIDEFAQKIDVTNPDHVMLYGADAQKKISSFADSALASVKNADTGEVGDMLSNLIGELKGFESTTEEPKGFFKKLFHNSEKQIATVKARYEDVSKNVEGIASSLENHQVQLLKDVAMFNHLYDTNLVYFKELTMYILAGEKRLTSVRANELQAARDKAAASGDALDAQKASDLDAACDRFEKKLHDLKLTRQVSLQMAPQIRLLQNNNSLLVERIQSTLVNTLPLWKNQMVLALGLHHSQQAMQAQRAVTDMTNELLKKNAATLKQGTIETAKEAERGVIDLQTLVETNQTLIDTINEVVAIQSDARNQRREAEKTLAQMEADLKKKLLEQ